MAPTEAPEENKDTKGGDVLSRVSSGIIKKLNKPKAQFQIDDAVQERSARLPYMKGRWVNACRYDETQECWMYRIRSAFEKVDPTWIQEHKLIKP